MISMESYRENLLRDSSLERESRFFHTSHMLYRGANHTQIGVPLATPFLSRSSQPFTAIRDRDMMRAKYYTPTHVTQERTRVGREGGAYHPPCSAMPPYVAGRPELLLYSYV